MNPKKRNINTIHFYSGIILTLFIGIHLFNHFISIFGVSTHIEMMDKLRLIYRNPIVELLLMSAVVMQIYSGLKLCFSFKNQAKGFYKKLQIWSGIYLAFFLLIHVSAVMVGRYLLSLDTNIYFGAAGLNSFPINLFFLPYYGLAIISFFGHISAIHFQKMNKKLFGLKVNQQSNLILLLGILVTLTILFGLTNGFSGMHIPKEYDILIGK